MRPHDDRLASPPATIAIRTPLGRMWHIATSPEEERTFCGLTFDDDYDTVMSYFLEDPAKDSRFWKAAVSDELICAHCRESRTRRQTGSRWR